jgi:hypothetical protein
MDGSNRVPDPHGLRASLWLEQHFFIESEMALFSECRLKCAQNLVDRADIVREGIYHESTILNRLHCRILLECERFSSPLSRQLS